MGGLFCVDATAPANQPFAAQVGPSGGVPPPLGTLHGAARLLNMECYTYNFTDLLAFTSPSMEMWLAPGELIQFASVVAQDMLSAHPDLVDKGMCVAVYNAAGTPVSIVPVGMVH